jgi:geranylgeranyl diphosphate synthase, type II
MPKLNEFVLLNKYQQQIALAINEKLPLFFNSKSLLHEACAYALSTGGKRIRPCLVLMVAKALGWGADVTFGALGIEFFHTASLVADDLPSMDDDDERRNQPSVHKKFGEGAALLVTYALIAAGYECIVKNTAVIKSSKYPFSHQSDYLGMLALENATYNTGFNGATGGQFLDIAPPDLSLETLKEIIHKKTSSLFEISFVFGWLFGGGDPQLLPQVKRAASHFGLAFQIADDLGDQEQDLINERKVNMANVFGRKAAIEMFHVEICAFLESLRNLNISSSDLVLLADCLSKEIYISKS